MFPARNLHWLAMFGCIAFLKIIESWLTTPKLEAWLRSLLACDIPSSSAGNSSSFQRPQPQRRNDLVESPKGPAPSLVNDSGVMHSPSDSVTDGPWSLWGGPEHCGILWLSLRNIEILLVLHLHFTKQEWKFTKNCEATLENSGVLPQALILRGNWALQGYPTSDSKLPPWLPKYLWPALWLLFDGGCTHPKRWKAAKKKRPRHEPQNNHRNTLTFGGYGAQNHSKPNPDGTIKYHQIPLSYSWWFPHLRVERNPPPPGCLMVV